MRSKILLVIAFSSCHFLALFCQTGACGSEMIRERYLKTDFLYQSKSNKAAEFSKSRIDNKRSSNSVLPRNSIYTIPVVVHILHKGGTDNISLEQVLSGLEILNNDFRKRNADFVDTPIPFQAYAADCEIEFCLANVDEFGNSSTGITRTEIPQNFDILKGYYNSDLGGKNPWDQSEYLNFWVSDLVFDLGVPGFSLPAGSNAHGDGVVIDFRFWGNVERSINSTGRVVTHEVGHFLNLAHTWGVPENCLFDDDVADTPPQAEPLFTPCPDFPHFDSCTPGGDGIMFMNFMGGGSETECQTFFTEGQKERMRSFLEGDRAALLTSQGCSSTVNLKDDFAGNQILLFPNPTSGSIEIDFENSLHPMRLLEVKNIYGQVLLRKEIENQNRFTLQMSFGKGIYFAVFKDEKDLPILVKKIILN